MASRTYPREAFAAVLAKLDIQEPTLSSCLAIIDVVFFASMMLEEGGTLPVAVLIDYGELERVTSVDHDFRDGTPERAWTVTRLDPSPLTPTNLKRIARGVTYGRDAVVVAHPPTGLQITAIARRNLRTDGGNVLRVAAPRPGVLVLEGATYFLTKYEAGEFGEDDLEVVRRDGPLRRALNECGVEAEWDVEELVKQARSTGCGALILFLRQAATPEMLAQLRFRMSEPDTLPRLKHDQQEYAVQRVESEVAATGPTPDPPDVLESIKAQHASTRAQVQDYLEQMGRLSAIDGALLIDPGLKFLGAGYLVTGRGDQPPPVQRALDIAATRFSNFRGGGARHAAGVRFTDQHAGSVAFIVSADGPVTCITKLETGLTAWSVRVPET